MGILGILVCPHSFEHVELGNTQAGFASSNTINRLRSLERERRGVGSSKQEGT
jgi:hypothetical protein